MDANEARRILADGRDTEDPIDLPVTVLSKLTVDDLPDGGAIQVGTVKDGTVHLDWNGTLGREEDEIYGEADHTWTRKYWYSPLGLEQYLDLVRRAVETRQPTAGSVASQVGVWLLFGEKMAIEGKFDRPKVLSHYCPKNPGIFGTPRWLLPFI